MNNEFGAPSFWKKSFHCPQCGCFAIQCWGTECIDSNGSWYDSICTWCTKQSAWRNKKLSTPIQPAIRYRDFVCSRSSEDIKKFYTNITGVSDNVPAQPIENCLRSVLEELDPYFSNSQKNIRSRIHGLKNIEGKELLEKGKNVACTIQTMENQCSDLAFNGLENKDTVEIVSTLLFLINLITDEKQDGRVYTILSKDKKDGIDNRDKALSAKKEPNT